jgi:mono/diheme cytochrome c family protein
MSADQHSPATLFSPAKPSRRSLAQRVIRVVGYTVATVAALACLSVGIVYAVTGSRMQRKYSVPEPTLVVRSDSVALTVGRHQAVINGCTSCHGNQLEGKIEVENFALGRMTGSNLTNGGRGAVLDARDWVRAVRHGLRGDSTPLLFMPAHELSRIADEHLAAIIAYARSIPASQSSVSRSYAGPLARVLFLTGDVTLLPAEKVDHQSIAPPTMPAERTIAFGRYLGTGCKGCHGVNYSGGVIPGAPPSWPAAANITPAGLVAYTRESFAHALRTGTRPGGSAIRPPMPINAYKEMTDVELDALWLYLQSLPKRAYGGR